MGLSAAALSVRSFFTATALMYPQRIVRQMSYQRRKWSNWCLHHLEDTKIFKCPSDYQMQGIRIPHKHLSLKVQGDYQMQRNSHSTQTLVTEGPRLSATLHCLLIIKEHFSLLNYFDTLIGTKQ